MTAEHPSPPIREAAFQFELRGDGPALLSVGESVEDLLGHRLNELVEGQVALSHLIHPDDTDLATDLFSPLPREYESVCNIRVRQASGQILCVKCQYRRHISDGRFILDLLLQDARTLPRTMAYVSRHSHAAAVLENTEDYIYFKDRNHVFTGASQTLASLCAPAEDWTGLLGLTDYDVFPEAAADAYYRLEKLVFAGEAVAHEVQEFVSRDGKKGWVDNRKYPIRDASGTIIGLHGIARDVTAAKSAEEALRASEARARAIIDASPVPLATSDAAGRITLANPAFTQTFGYELADTPMVSDWWPKAYPDPSYREWVIASWTRELARSAATRTPFEPMEVQVRCKDGTNRVALIGAAPLGRDIRADQLVFFHDVTSRKQAERQLQRTAHMLAEAQRLAHMGSWELIAATDQVFWSEELFRIFGMNPAEPVPSYPEQARIFGPESWKRVSTAVERCLKTGQTYELEAEIVRADGSRGWAWLRGEPMRDERGEPLGLRGVALDITERRLAEAARRLSEVVFRSISQGVIVTSPERRIISANEAFCAITGYSEAEVLGRDCELLLGTSTNPATIAAFRSALANKTAFSGEIESHRSDGAPFWNELTLSPVFDADGVHTHFIVVTRDITSRKEMERKNAEIEAQLHQAQRLETVGTLAAGIAHDFNNILAVIVVNAELAVADVGDRHSAHEPLREIQKASQRAKTLVQQLLAFSSPHPQSKQPLTLGPLVHEVAAMLRATIPASVEIVTSVDGDTPPALADASQMHQSLVNLCTNAWHALDDRPGTIEVRLTSVTFGPMEASEISGLPPGRYVCLSVRDTGIGMDAATRQRIFDPFFTTKSPGKGTGLGLSVVHGIVAAHQGGIQVQSAPGEGATFTLFLPAAETSVVVDTPREPVVEPPRDFKGHIAYIDDEEMLARVASRSLQRLGHRVTSFVRAKDAVSALLNDPHQFDVVVTDLNMPEVTGLWVAAEVRKVRADLPIVLVSGHLNEDLRRAAADSGIAAIVSKPFKARELSDIIAALPLSPRGSGGPP